MTYRLYTRGDDFVLMLDDAILVDVDYAKWDQEIDRIMFVADDDEAYYVEGQHIVLGPDELFPGESPPAK